MRRFLRFVEKVDMVIEKAEHLLLRLVLFALLAIGAWRFLASEIADHEPTAKPGDIEYRDPDFGQVGAE